MRRTFLISLLAVAVVGMLTVPALAFNAPGHTNNLARPGNPNDPNNVQQATEAPTTAVPTTAVPTTAVPTTAVPTTAVPTTAVPTTAVPTTAVPTTTTPTATGTQATAVSTTPVPSATATGPTATPTRRPRGTREPRQGFPYVVQPGDTLASIAMRFGTTVDALVRANRLADPNQIYVGQVLLIVGSVYPFPTYAYPTYPYPYPTYPYPLVTLTPYYSSASSTFILGGQVANLSANTVSAMQSSKMTWVKYEVQEGDLNALNLLSQAKTAGFKVLFTILGDTTQVLDPAFQDTYATYAGALAKAGADGIEVWTEENIDRQWPTGQINPAVYVTLLRKAYVVIKGVNTNTLVISGGLFPTGAESTLSLTTTWNDDHYYGNLATYGMSSYADCIGVHYTEGAVSPTQTSGDPRDNYPTRYFDTMVTRVQTIFPNKPLCFTELGYLSPEGYGPLPTNLAWAANVTAAQQAQWLGQAVGRARSNTHITMLIVDNVDYATYDTDALAGYAMLRPQNTCAACAAIAAASPN